jgi:hypothetical protein
MNRITSWNWFEDLLWLWTVIHLATWVRAYNVVWLFASDVRSAERHRITRRRRYCDSLWGRGSRNYPWDQGLHLECLRFEWAKPFYKSDTVSVSYHPFAFDEWRGSRRPLAQLLTRESWKKAVEDLQDNMGVTSNKLNLHWWTVWNGLMGTLDNQIYGAGLLFPHWRMVYVCWMKYKTPLFHCSAPCQFWHNKTATQLYVTPNFAYLNLVLEEFANKMALRTGEHRGIEKP